MLFRSEAEADRLARAGLASVQVSIYSHRPEVHDAITKLPRSLERSIAGIRLLRARGVKVTIANVLMRSNLNDYAASRRWRRSDRRPIMGMSPGFGTWRWRSSAPGGASTAP